MVVIPPQFGHTALNLGKGDLPSLLKLFRFMSSNCQRSTLTHLCMNARKCWERRRCPACRNGLKFLECYVQDSATVTGNVCLQSSLHKGWVHKHGSYWQTVLYGYAALTNLLHQWWAVHLVLKWSCMRESGFCPSFPVSFTLRNWVIWGRILGDKLLNIGKWTPFYFFWLWERRKLFSNMVEVEPES